MAIYPVEIVGLVPFSKDDLSDLLGSDGFAKKIASSANGQAALDHLKNIIAEEIVNNLSDGV